MRAGAKETKDVLAQAKKNETTKVRRRSAMGMAKTIRVNCDERTGVGRMDGAESAVDETTRERGLIERRACGVSRLRELFDEAVLWRIT